MVRLIVAVATGLDAASFRDERIDRGVEFADGVVQAGIQAGIERPGRGPPIGVECHRAKLPQSDFPLNHRAHDKGADANRQLTEANLRVGRCEHVVRRRDQPDAPANDLSLDARDDGLGAPNHRQNHAREAEEKLLACGPRRRSI